MCINCCTCYPSQEPSTWLVRRPAPLSALQQLLVASMALGVGIQRQVLSWWPFSLIHFPPTWRFGNTKSVLGLWWDIWAANVEIIHYVQGMLETYISGAHTSWPHPCNMIVAYGDHCDYAIWGPGYWCAGLTLHTCKFVSQRLWVSECLPKCSCSLFCIPMRSECHLWMSPQHFLYDTGLFTFAP